MQKVCNRNLTGNTVCWHKSILILPVISEFQQKKSLHMCNFQFLKIGLMSTFDIQYIIYVAPNTSLARLSDYTGCAFRSAFSIRSPCWHTKFFMGLLHVIWARLPVCRRALRSASTSRLVIPPFKLSTIGSRTFEIAAALTWNDLPEDVTSSPTLPICVIDWKPICFVNHIRTLLCGLNFLFPYSGFEGSSVTWATIKSYDWLLSVSVGFKRGSVDFIWFKLNCGIRQGGVLSPYLFTVYIDSIVSKVKSLGIGCHLGLVCFSIFLYADDISLLAPSISSLQKIVNVCKWELRLLDLAISSKKISVY